jgi:hypothetical protein
MSAQASYAPLLKPIFRLRLVGLTPTGKRRLLTAHTHIGRFALPVIPIRICEAIRPGCDGYCDDHLSATHLARLSDEEASEC